MSKITLKDPTSGYSSVQTFTENNTLIEEALNDKVLYRDNPAGETNTMQNDLDMNSNRILNLPSATANGEPLTYGQWTGGVTTTEFTGYLNETQTATASQTVFTLTNTFTVGIGALRVFVNGVYQAPSAYTEDSTTQITFSEGLDLNDQVTFIISSFTAAGSTDAASVTYTPTGTGATATNVKEKLTRVYDVKDFGAVGDGATDDTAAITTAITAAAGSTLLFPKGTYVVAIDQTAMFTPSTNITILGEGVESVIKFNMTDTTTRTLFSISNSGVHFQDLKILLGTSVASGTIIGFALSADRFSLRNVEIDGAVPDASSHLFQTINVAETGTFGDLEITGCNIHDITRVWLRTVTSTSTVSGVRVTNNKFYNSESSMFALNGVLGTVQDVVFSGNTFLDPYIDTVQSDSFCIGPHAKNVTITGNTFRGTAHDCIHIEEKAENVLISNNVINMDCSSEAIYVSDNNASGGYLAPDRLVITNNVILRSDEDGATGIGIRLVNDGSGTAPSTSTVISNNVIEGWGTGILCGAEQDDTVTGSDNVIKNSGVGLKAVFGVPGLRNTTLVDCTIGLQTIQGGGTFGYTIFDNCTTNADGVLGDIVLNGAEFIFPRSTIAASTNTDFALLPIASTDRSYGILTANVFHSDTNEDTQASEITWDGSSLTSTSKLAKGGGQITISFVDSSSVLTLRAANSSTALTNASVYVKFNGTHLVST